MTIAPCPTANLFSSASVTVCRSCLICLCISQSAQLKDFSYIFAKLNSKYTSREGIFPLISSTMNAPKALAWFFTRVRQVFHATKPIQFLKLFVNCA